MRANRRVIALVSTILVASLALGGCAKKATETTPPASEETAAKPVGIKIGTLTTEDILPLWVAEEKGYFAEEGIPAVEIITFQSAQEVNAALTSGAIDAAMGDVLNAAALYAGGTKVSLPFVTLGSEASQGRFGIVAGPGSSLKTLEDLKGVPVGIGSNTILEYMFDKMMAAEGIPADQVKKEEIKKIPVRFEMMMSGQVAAAALPNSFIALAEKQGAVVIADDTKGENLTQSIFMVTDKFLSSRGGQATIDALKAVWDRGVADVNANPNDYRRILVDKARLPEVLKDSYQVSEYPEAAVPTAKMVDAQLEWMKSSGYLNADLSYDGKTGKFSLK